MLPYWLPAVLAVALRESEICLSLSHWPAPRALREEVANLLLGVVEAEPGDEDFERVRALRSPAPFSIFSQNERFRTRLLAVFRRSLCVHSFQQSRFFALSHNSLCIQKRPPATRRMPSEQKKNIGF